MKPASFWILLGITVSCLFAPPYEVWGQSPALDSLWGVATHPETPPQQKLEAYLGWAYKGFTQKTPQALEAGQEALALAATLADTTALGKGNLIVGICYSIMAEYDSAVGCLSHALHHSEKVDDTETHIRSLQTMGIISYRSGKPEEALDYFHLVEEQCEIQNDSAGLSRIYTNIGNVAWYQGCLEDALSYYRCSLELKEALKDSQRMPLVLGNQGLIYMERGQYAKALGFFTRSMRILERHQNQIGMATVLSNIGEIYMRMGDEEVALNYIQFAQDIQEELSLNLAFHRSQAQLAKAHFGLGHKELAYALFEFSECEQHKLRDAYGLACTYFAWAECVQKTDAWEQALALSYQGVDACKRADAVQMMLDGYELLATCYRQRGQWDSVYLYASRMHTLVNEQQLTRRAPDAYELLAACAAQVGDYKQAYSYISLAEQLRQQQQEQQVSGEEVRSEIKYWINRSQETQKARQKARLTQAQMEILQNRSQQERTWVYLGALLVLTVALSIFYLIKQHNHELLQAKQRDLSHKNQELASLQQERTNLLGVITHGMRTPVSQIQALSNILQTEDDLSPTNKAKFLEAIGSAAYRLSHHIDQVLTLNSLEAKSVTWDMKSVKLLEQVQTLLHQTAPVFYQKSLTPKTDFQDEACSALADPAHLSIVIDNLLSNAIKFSPPGKFITIGTRCHPEEDEVWLYVKDEGPGIPQDDLTRMFDKYQKLQNRPTQGEPSTGLGLAIAKAYVEEMQGRIWVESQPGEGATFWIALPAAHPDEHAS